MIIIFGNYNDTKGFVKSFFTGRPGCKKRDAAPSKTEKVLHLVFIWGKGKNGRQKDHSAHRSPRIWMKSG